MVKKIEIDKVIETNENQNIPFASSSNKVGPFFYEESAIFAIKITVKIIFEHRIIEKIIQSKT